MDTTDKLIADFRSGRSDRCWLISQLEEVDDPRVIGLFLATLNNATEEDSVRIEVLKSLGVRRDTPSTRTKLALAIQKILETDDDEVVRQHAARALRHFVDLDGVADMLEGRARNTSEDLDVRYNCLCAIEANLDLPGCLDVMHRLVAVPDIGATAQAAIAEHARRCGEKGRDSY